MSIYFITGIDTGIGKSFVTGLMARFLLLHGEKVITAKAVQTGCEKLSEDLALHREIMGLERLPEDEQGLTCPYLFSFPASPHLSAALENREVDPSRILAAVRVLSENFSTVLLEGAGGIRVPLRDRYTMLDLAAEGGFSTVVVTSPRLGSLNHTLLTVDALLNRGIAVAGLAYNLATPAAPEIQTDSLKTLARFYPEIPLVEVPRFSPNSPPEVDFSPFFRSRNRGQSP